MSTNSTAVNAAISICKDKDSANNYPNVNETKIETFLNFHCQFNSNEASSETTATVIYMAIAIAMLLQMIHLFWYEILKYRQRDKSKCEQINIFQKYNRKFSIISLILNLLNIFMQMIIITVPNYLELFFEKQ